MLVWWQSSLGPRSRQSMSASTMHSNVHKNKLIVKLKLIRLTRQMPDVLLVLSCQIPTYMDANPSRRAQQIYGARLSACSQSACISVFLVPSTRQILHCLLGREPAERQSSSCVMVGANRGFGIILQAR